MVGGVATVTHNLSQDLASAGHHVWVIAPSEGHYHQHTQHGAVQVHRFASFEWPTYIGQRIAFPPVTPLRRLLHSVQPDVVHIHSPIVLGNVAQLWSSALHVPVVATNHYMPMNMSPSLSTDPLLGKSFEALAYSYLVSFYNRCDFVTAPTVTALDLLKRHGLRVPSQPISNGIDLTQFTPGTRDEALRRRYDLPADRPILLYLGRLSEEKRVQVLLEAMTQLRTPAHLAIGGDGPAAADLEAQAEALGVRSRVSFLGRIADEDLVATYRLADLFVMPSVAELQSVATLEAMAVGLPVVAADAGALPELVVEDESGLRFTPNDSAALADRLTCLSHDVPMRQRMGRQAMQVARLHDRGHVLQQWEQLYAGLAETTQRVTGHRARRSTALSLDHGLRPRIAHRAAGRLKPLSR
jgi:glycosyltransferase involved in cell wall biosynthesis